MYKSNLKHYEIIIIGHENQFNLKFESIPTNWI